jgi:hypothetical protein
MIFLLNNGQHRDNAKRRQINPRLPGDLRKQQKFYTRFALPAR